MEEQDTATLVDKISELCSSFLDERWSHLTSSNLKIFKIKSKSNQVFHCILLDDNEKIIDQVVVKFYGSSWIDDNKNSLVPGKSADVLIFYILSQKKCGPMLFGVFDEGRIEEYINATKLTVGQYESKQFYEILAKKLAWIHSLKVPLKKNQKDMIKYIKSLNDNYKSNASLEDYLCSRKQNKWSNFLMKVNFNLELQFVFQFFKKIPSKIVFSHNDLNISNFLIKKTDKSSEETLSDENVMLIDFEYCSYNFRWADICTFFSEICMNHRKKHENLKFQFYPKPEEQLFFLTRYFKEMMKIEMDLTMRDIAKELEVLKQEVAFGSLIVNLIQVLWRLVNSNIANEEKNEELWEEAFHRYQLYQKLKQDFIQEYHLI